MADSKINPAIRFELDAFDMRRPDLMGRQSAGAGFLRAALGANREIVGYGPNDAGAGQLAELVATLDPTATTRWIRSDQLDKFNALGVCHRADHAIVREAMTRLRVGPARHSLCGVTHSLSTPGASEIIASYATAPLMPWDAVICTTQAARDVVDAVLEEELAYLTWRLDGASAPNLPQFPIIPLGVHCDDLAGGPGERAEARRKLGLREDQIVALYAGRVSISGKAHPFPMLTALQAAAERTGKPVVLLIAGRFVTDFVEQAYRSGVAQFSPDVRVLHVDGRDFAAYRDAWLGADIFVSLADSIQETFGLTPVEAMAAGLPCLVSDWNGYRETVRDGIDGFRVRSWAPEGGGEPVARALEAEVISTGRYYWHTDSTVSVDLAEVTDRLCDLIESPDLRRRMGEAGRRRAREVFDWRGVYAQHQELWGELDARRRAVVEDPLALAKLVAAPKTSPARLEAARMFRGHPTSRIGAETQVSLVPGATLARFEEVASHALFTGVGVAPHLAGLVLARLVEGSASLGRLAAELRHDGAALMPVVGKLAKMGLVRFDDR